MGRAWDERRSRWNDTIPLVVVAHSFASDFVVFPSSPPPLPLCTPPWSDWELGTGNCLGGLLHLSRSRSWDGSLRCPPPLPPPTRVGSQIPLTLGVFLSDGSQQLVTCAVAVSQNNAVKLHTVRVRAPVCLLFRRPGRRAKPNIM